MDREPVILVVRGDSEESENIARILSDQYCVIAAEDPENALDHVNDSVDLVITELESRKFSGLELLRQWKARRPQTPVLAVTDGRDVNTAVEAMKLGAADCIVRPVNPAELRSLASRLVEGHQVAEVASGAGHNTEGKTIDIPPGTSLEDLERAAVEQALAQHHGNRTHAAKTLGISVRTLQRKLKAWGMPMTAMQHAASGNQFGLPAHHEPHPHAPFGVHAH